MDLKIATALNLSPDLVWFNRQSFAEEMSSLSSDESDVFGQGRQSYYGGYFPEMPHDLGSDGTQSPVCDDTDDADSTGDDFSHALFAQEQMLLDGSCDFAEPMEAPVHPYDKQAPMNTIRVPSSRPSPITPQCHPVVMEISYSPSPSSTPSPFPELMVASSPVQMAALAPVSISRQHDNTRRRQIDMAAWQKVALRLVFSADCRQPGREKLRELAVRTHLPVTTISFWFAEQRRSLRLRLKFGFSFSGPSSRTAHRRTPKISTPDTAEDTDNELASIL